MSKVAGTTCPVWQKRAYPTRRLARLAARQAHPGERLSAYACGSHFHLGHLPQAVAGGFRDRREWCGR